MLLLYYGAMVMHTLFFDHDNIENMMLLVMLAGFLMGIAGYLLRKEKVIITSVAIFLLLLIYVAIYVIVNIVSNPL